MAELQLCSTRDDLNSQAQPQLWGTQIQDAPLCIILMARCKLLLSKASLAGLDLSGSGLTHQSLLVAMGRFHRMGESTFRSTATRMRTVGCLTHDMCKPDGTGEMIDILYSTLQDLDNLQMEIAKFMDFLIGIQDIMVVVKDGDDRVLIRDLTAKDIDDMNDDPQLKEDYLRDARLMKKRLFIASRATELYNEISDKFILPGVSWVGRLSTLNLSDEAYDKMELEIEAKRSELSEGAKRLIMERVDEIGIALKVHDPQSTAVPQANVTEVAEDTSEEFEELVNA
ncbi:hypothetical protein FoTM2_014912 [Fusarium oxysporum f. sp. vasinfectum]|nr:hypothetical protein FoTM2_014912 [Fusarium oxysporum f. sp. vasinfectum]